MGPEDIGFRFNHVKSEMAIRDSNEMSSSQQCIQDLVLDLWAKNRRFNMISKTLKQD